MAADPELELILYKGNSEKVSENGKMLWQESLAEIRWTGLKLFMLPIQQSPSSHYVLFHFWHFSLLNFPMTSSKTSYTTHKALFFTTLTDLG